MDKFEKQIADLSADIENLKIKLDSLAINLPINKLDSLAVNLKQMKC